MVPAPLDQAAVALDAQRRWAALRHLTRSAGEIAAMYAVKSALDPDGLLSPGVLFAP